MALISAQDKRRIDIPDEDGQWVEIRPLTVADGAAVESVSAGQSQVALSLKLLSRCIVAWSYPPEISEETVGQLDMDTFKWLMSEVDVSSGRRDEDQKKGSGSGLSPQPRPQQPKSSRKNSAT